MSTRPAFLTAVTSVDSTGLADAAVATGAVDMPVKLPAPDLGTEAQPGPKSRGGGAGGGRADDIGAEDEDAAAERPTAAVDERLELHAAAPRAQVGGEAGQMARIRRFIMVSLRSVLT